jgi:hypothetical protein
LTTPFDHPFSRVRNEWTNAIKTSHQLSTINNIAQIAAEIYKTTKALKASSFINGVGGWGQAKHITAL